MGCKEATASREPVPARKLRLEKVFMVFLCKKFEVWRNVYMIAKEAGRPPLRGSRPWLHARVWPRS
jgi:hypothetical protein